MGLPRVYFGKIDDEPVDWRAGIGKLDDPDDDEELDETPGDVIGMLGFDPKERT